MKISLEWLNDYLPGVPRDVGAQRAADVLMNGGLPVETIETIGDDTVIDVEVTSNRADCLSHVGVARELAALLGCQFVDVKPAAPESRTSVAQVTSVAIDAPQLCPYYSARVIRGVKVGPSPAWMVRRLEAVGLRSINNVVDISNYVMMELGQPLHAFDYDKLAGGRIIVRHAAKGEKLVSIDGKTRELDPEMLVIADAKDPVALAGVMGGKDSEVGDGTINLLLESARFDPLSVRKTSRKLALRSDSSYRFERGIDPTLAERASLRAAQLILETAGGELLAGVATAGDASFSPKRVTLRLSKIRSVLGIDVPAAEAVSALARLGFAPVTSGETIECTAPSWRQDVSIEVDLVEEVARAIGYDRIPFKQAIEIRLTPPQEDLRAVDQIRAALVAAGYFEALTFSWVTDALRDDFKPAEAKGLLRAEESVRKDNAHLRPSMLPGLLEAVRRNETVGNPRAKLFEIGSTFWVNAAGKVDERRRVAVVGSPDYREVRGAVEAMLESLDAAKGVRIVPDERAGYTKGGCGRVEWGGRAIGYIGKVDAAIAQKLDLREAPAAAELELEPLIAGAQWLPQVRELAKFPSVKRDLSLVVAERVRYEEIESIVRELKLPSLEGVQYVTTYRGKQIGPGSKSVTIELVFRSDTGTLTSEAVEGSVQRVVGAAKERVGAVLRV
ncbi:MAG: pheT [Phycisphaerales bacterium]|nr:pheT [Phycisphaerales bacterium]